MPFSFNARAAAASAMLATPHLTESFATLVRFLAAHPETAPGFHGKNAPSAGSTEYINRLAARFADARKPKAPKPPETIPDEMVSVILVSYFGIDAAEVERIKREHALSMGAENVVGDLLERYIATVAEPRDWVWCSGSCVKAVDFIRPPVKKGGKWAMLQVKNRDNSENSSSSAIRNNTTILKWHRTFSKSAGSNWNAFPDETLRPELSEEGFKTFVKAYLRPLQAARR